MSARVVVCLAPDFASGFARDSEIRKLGKLSEIGSVVDVSAVGARLAQPERIAAKQQMIRASPAISELIRFVIRYPGLDAGKR